MSGLEGLLAGRTLAGRYRIEEVIGRGGYAAVYRASDERLGRTVAVKVITVVAADLATRDQVRRRFEREARIAASLDHPNVVTVYDVGTDPELELDFLVMELLRGDDLARRIAKPVPFPLPMAARILRDAARGIAAGHRGGLIHRDVKPANIFLAEHEREERFRVCVLDFGIAQIRSGEHSLTKLTRGAAPLSPRYASPEQLQEDVELTPASDVFSLGVIGYELVTGERPFGRDQVRSMTRGEPPSPPPFDAVPVEVRDIIRRAMEWDPEQRYPDAGELADALEAALGTMRSDSPVVAAPVPAEAPTVAEPAVLPASAPPVASAPEPAPVVVPEPAPVASVPEIEPAAAAPVASVPETASAPPAPVAAEPAPASPVVRAPEPAAARPRESAPVAAAPVPTAHTQRRRNEAEPTPKRARRTSPLLLLAIPLLLAIGGLAWWLMAPERPAEPRRAQVEAPPPAAAAPPAPVQRTPDSLAWSAANQPSAAPGAAAQDPGATPGGVPGTGAPATGAPATGAPAGGGVAPAGGTPRTPAGTLAGTQPPQAPAAGAATGGAAAARYAREADAHFERGNLPAAVAGFRRAVAAAPGNALYRNQLGWALFQAGDLAGAERELQETLRLDPDRAIAHANLGEVRRVQGDTERAIGNYRRFLELNTDARRERIAREKLRGMGATP